MSWNPDSPSVRPTLLCYADLLGFRAETQRFFQSGHADDFLKRIKASLRKAYKIVSDANDLPRDDTSILMMKVFTDNIVVAYPLNDPYHDDGEGELGHILLLFAQVQATLAMDGFLLRGAVSLGQHYQDGDLSYGNALFEAVDLDQTGSAPRVVMAPSVEPLILRHLASYGTGESPHYSVLLEDPDDDRLFLNYLGTELQLSPEAPFHRKLLSKHRDRVVIGLQQHSFNPRVRLKYEWLARYHNFVCCTLAKQHPMALKYLAPADQGALPRLVDPARLRQRMPRLLRRRSWSPATLSAPGLATV